jgi:hypothetical protein
MSVIGEDPCYGLEMIPSKWLFACILPFLFFNLMAISRVLISNILNWKIVKQRTPQNSAPFIYYIKITFIGSFMLFFAPFFQLGGREGEGVHVEMSAS